MNEYYFIVGSGRCRMSQMVYAPNAEMAAHFVESEGIDVVGGPYDYENWLRIGGAFYVLPSMKVG